MIKRANVNYCKNLLKKYAYYTSLYPEGSSLYDEYPHGLFRSMFGGNGSSPYDTMWEGATIPDSAVPKLTDDQLRKELFRQTYAYSRGIPKNNARVIRSLQDKQGSFSWEDYAALADVARQFRGKNFTDNGKLGVGSRQESDYINNKLRDMSNDEFKQWFDTNKFDINTGRGLLHYPALQNLRNKMQDPNIPEDTKNIFINSSGLLGKRNKQQTGSNLKA